MADHPGRPSARQQQDGVKVDAWYGLRYAQTPARFAPPAPAGGRLEAETLSEVPIFPQRPSRLAAAMGTGRPNPQAEDAFFANIWAPSGAQDLPVLLFVHGGAWITGGGAMDWYDGRVLASRGLVVVTVNYRLGALGHLGRSDAHALPLPAADLLQALHWLRDRIRAFGGDPDRVTLAGQSAGGWYAHLLSVLPQARGLLRRVSLMSMGTRRPWSPQRQADITHKTAEHLGAAEIGHAPVDEVMRAGLQALDVGAPALGHAPSAFLPVASAAVPDRLLDPEWAAKACHAEAVSLRTTADESAMFLFASPEHRNATQAQVDEVLSTWAPADLPATLRRDGAYAGDTSGLSPYRQLVAASSWRQFQRFPAQYHAALLGQRRRSRLETFAEESDMPGLHSGHCLDLPFQFGRQCAWDDAPMLQGCDAERFEAVSSRLIGGLVAFVTGEARPDQAPMTSST